MADVRRAITDRNRDISGGEIESGKRRYLLRTIGRFEELDDLGRLILARRGDSLIRLDDVAELKIHHFELSGWKEPQIIIRFWIVAFVFALFSDSPEGDGRILEHAMDLGADAYTFKPATIEELEEALKIAKAKRKT